MKTIRMPALACTCLMMLGAISTRAAQTDVPAPPDPLKRFDPYGKKPAGLIAVHGNPRLGLTSAPGDRIQRVADNQWFIETRISGIAVLEPDFRTGEVLLKELIQAYGTWCVSTDAKWMFACNRFSHNNTPVSACFRLATGKPAWTFDNSSTVYDASFTPDGKNLLVFGTEHSDAKQPFCVVSWYDPSGGKLIRKVKLPDPCKPGTFVPSQFHLAVSDNAVYLSRPNEVGHRCFIIGNGDTQARPVTDADMDSENPPDVCVGGPHREFVAFTTGRAIRLFREEQGSLLPCKDIRLEENVHWGSNYNTRISPSGNILTATTCDNTFVMPTGTSADEPATSHPFGSRLGDFTADGKYYLSFDDGGGTIYNTSTWEPVGKPESAARSLHCCPITEAGYSMSGDFIISNDDHHLLLWTKEGRLLAELDSPKKGTRCDPKMQSPVLVERTRRIYAADGWDFLEWDLDEVLRLAAKNTATTAHSAGKVVFHDSPLYYREPSTMNIQLNSDGDKIITATRDQVRFRPLKSSDPVRLAVPVQDIYMIPRSFHLTDMDSTLYVRNSLSVFKLDPAGKQMPVNKISTCVGLDADDDLSFFYTTRKDAIHLAALSLKTGAAIDYPVPLPASWRIGNSATRLLIKHGPWIVACPYVSGHSSSLGVIDWEHRRVIWTEPLPWAATSLEFSHDGKKLIVGSFNRAVYEFDFQRLLALAAKAGYPG